MNKIVVGYCRLSRDDRDNESSSITNQREIIEKYAAQHNMKVDKFYWDDGVSGYVMDRPYFNEMKRDLNKGVIGTVIVKDYSRLGRHNAKVQLFIENLINSNVRVISINDNYDSIKGEDEMLPFKAIFNERYVKDASRKTKQALRNMQEKGGLVTQVPYGYILDPVVKNKYSVDKRCAMYIQQIFDFYVNGDGLFTIARKLTEANIPTPSMMEKQRLEDLGLTFKGHVTSKWNTGSISNILSNDFYIGTLRCGKTKRTAIRGSSIELPKEEHLVFRDAHESLVDKETFNLAQEIMAKRSIRPYRGIQKYPNLFTGFLICADCRNRLTTTRSRNGDTRYKCRTYHDLGRGYCTSHAVSESDLLEILFEYLDLCKDKLKIVINSLDDIIMKDVKQYGGDMDTLEFLQAEYDKTAKKTQFLIQERVSKIIQNPEMEDIIEATYESVMQEHYAKLASLKKQIDDHKNVAKNKLNLQKNLESAYSMFLDIIVRKTITKKQLGIILDQIVVHEDGSLEIYLKGNLHKALQPHSNTPEVYTKKHKLTKKQEQVLMGIVEYIQEEKCRNKLFPKKTTEYLCEHNLGVTYVTVKWIFDKLEADGHIKRNNGYNKGYMLIHETNEIINDYLTYNSCIPAAQFLNNSVTLDILFEINDWIESLDDNKTNKKLLF